MELLRQWGLDHRVREASMAVRFVNSIRMTTLASPTITEMPLGYPDAEASRLVSPVMPAALPQDMFEPILLDAARSDHDAEIRFNTELTSVPQDDAGIIATIVDRTTIDDFMPWRSFSGMTDEELHALWLHLRSMPPRQYGNK
jgi:putative polyketide hydroxylase